MNRSLASVVVRQLPRYKVGTENGTTQMALPRLPVGLEGAAKKGPGRYNVAKLFKGAPKGLYLHVRDNGSRCWVFRYRARP